MCGRSSFSLACPILVIPDNPRTGVNRACRYEPDLNRTYHEMAQHYGVAVMPARPYKPRDKAKVESAVGVVERWILAALRHRKFFSIGELNEAIAELLRTPEPPSVPQTRRHARLSVCRAGSTRSSDRCRPNAT